MFFAEDGVVERRLRRKLSAALFSRYRPAINLRDSD